MNYTWTSSTYALSSPSNIKEDYVASLQGQKSPEILLPVIPRLQSCQRVDIRRPTTLVAQRNLEKQSRDNHCVIIRDPKQKTPAISRAQNPPGALKFAITRQRNDSSVSNIQLSCGHSHSKERAYEPHGQSLVSSAICHPKIPTYLIKRLKNNLAQGKATL